MSCSPSRTAASRPPLHITCALLILLGLAPFVAALAAGNPSPALAGNGDAVRVALLTGVKSAAAGATCAYQVFDRRSGVQIVDGSAWSAFDLAQAAGGVKVGSLGTYPGGVQVKPKAGANGPVTLNGRQYRGFLDVIPGYDGGLLVVNEAGMEDYLRGVVPREMYPSWPAEALKAQAVAARTYALCQVLASRASGALFAVHATTSSQVYGGISAEQASTDAAIAATAGLVLTYGGQPISAVYHSSSGGHTEDSENVWAGTKPYLRGVPDFDQGSPKYSWTSSLTPDEVAYRLTEAGHNIGTVLGIEPTGGKGVSGRWLSVGFVGTKGTAVLKGEDARRVLGLHSTLFEVEFVGRGVADLVSHIDYGSQVSVAGVSAGQVVIAARKAGTNYSIGPEGVLYRLDAAAAIYRTDAAGRVDFLGHGWGHGVGMSQWGAYQMASEGKTFDQILNYYYQGTVLEAR